MSRVSDQPTSILTQAREVFGWTLVEVGDTLGSNSASISRIERAVQMGRRPLYRKLYEFYGTVVPLGDIYDPYYNHPVNGIPTLNDKQIKALAQIAKNRTPVPKTAVA